MRVMLFCVLALLGCGDTIHSDPIGTPVALIEATPLSGDVPLIVQFSGERSHWEDGIGAGSSYSWSFGDGDDAEGEEVHHTYVEAGSYEACLTFGAEDDETLTDMVCVTIAAR